ncbi:hypothetical protein D9M68_901570 [compost metagenome]
MFPHAEDKILRRFIEPVHFYEFRLQFLYRPCGGVKLLNRIKCGKYLATVQIARAIAEPAAHLQQGIRIIGVAYKIIDR